MLSRLGNYNCKDNSFFFDTSNKLLTTVNTPELNAYTVGSRFNAKKYIGFVVALLNYSTGKKQS